jgi:hypothetical protein
MLQAVCRSRLERQGRLCICRWQRLLPVGTDNPAVASSRITTLPHQWDHERRPLAIAGLCIQYEWTSYRCLKKNAYNILVHSPGLAPARPDASAPDVRARSCMVRLSRRCSQASASTKIANCTFSTSASCSMLFKQDRRNSSCSKVCSGSIQVKKHVIADQHNPTSDQLLTVYKAVSHQCRLGQRMHTKQWVAGIGRSM